MTPTASPPKVKASASRPTPGTVGTGPYKFGEYDEANDTITLEAQRRLLGREGQGQELVFKIIPDESARRQELEAGTIDGYDLPNPADWEGLRRRQQSRSAPAFNILYLGINPRRTRR